MARGWAVILPSRRGRGGSERRYDEGFDIDRTRGYSCPTLSLPGADRALRDIDAVTPVLLAQPFVDRSGFDVAGQINQTLFRRGAAFPQPMLWLYGDRDRFYSLAHSRSNLAAFQAAGGKGTFNEFTPPDGVNGHSISGYPALWGDKVATYLAERGL